MSIFFLQTLRTIFTASLTASIFCAISTAIAPDAHAELDQATTTSEIKAVKSRLDPKQKAIIDRLDARLDEKSRKQIAATMRDITLRTASGQYSEDLITAIASMEAGSFSDCYCCSVEYSLKNNYSTAPTDIELFINDDCVVTSYSLPNGVTELKTDSSTIFTFSTAATMEFYAETGYAGGSPCDFVTITLEAY